jgi:hypothetical protein
MSFGQVPWHETAPQGWIAYNFGVILREKSIPVIFVGTYAAPGEARLYVHQDSVLFTCGESSRSNRLPIRQRRIVRREGDKNIYEELPVAQLLQWRAKYPDSLGASYYNWSMPAFYFEPSAWSQEDLQTAGWVREKAQNISTKSSSGHTIGEYVYLPIAPKYLDGADIGTANHSDSAYIGFSATASDLFGPLLRTVAFTAEVDGVPFQFSLLSDMPGESWCRVPYDGTIAYYRKSSRGHTTSGGYLHTFPFRRFVEQYRKLATVPLSREGERDFYIRVDEMQFRGASNWEVSRDIFVDAEGTIWCRMASAQPFPADIRTGLVQSDTLRDMGMSFLGKSNFAPVIYSAMEPIRQLYCSYSDIKDPVHAIQRENIVLAYSTSGSMHLVARSKLNSDKLKLREQRYAACNPRTPATDAILLCDDATFDVIVADLENIRDGKYTYNFNPPFPWALLGATSHPLIGDYLKQHDILRRIPVLGTIIYPSDWNLTPESPDILPLLANLSPNPVTLMILQGHAWHEFLQTRALAYLSAAGLAQHDIVRLISYIEEKPEIPTSS